jgi:hypothetical protein
MKRTLQFLAGFILAALASSPLAFAQKVGKLENPKPKSEPSPPPPAYRQTAPPPGTGPVFVYDQKPVPGRPALVSPEQAQTIIDRFKAAYPKMGRPRLLIYVNRELVDQKSGLKMIARTEKTETILDAKKGTRPQAQPKERVTSENRYRNDEATPPTLADKQTVRDVERLFGRPLRLGQAQLTDQRVATQLIPSGSFQSLALEGEQARKDREALSKFADVVIEVLIASKNVTVAGLTGDQVYAVPDIQATAIRLSDAKIMGQASSADLSGGNPSPAFARSFGVHEVTEATALALMEDMVTGYDAPTESKAEPAPR